MKMDLSLILRALRPVQARLMARLKAKPADPAPFAIPDLRPGNAAEHLRIPVYTPPDLPDETQVLHDEGQFLARQDRWGDLAQRIRQTDQRRMKTADFIPLADLLLAGARRDVVAAAEHALADGVPEHDGALRSGVALLEEVHDEYPDDYAIALTVALSHLDIGRAWRGPGLPRDLSASHRRAFQAHFDRAATILDRFCGIELNSPALAAARCALLDGMRDPHLRVADDYEDLIDLDPTDQRHMRALGRHLLPCRFGSYDALELEARRTASRTHDIWGDAAYAWVYFDAIIQDPEACVRVDADFFADGLRDILRRRPDQANVNMLAAYCAIALGAAQDPGSPRARISACAEWIICDHLRELHPLIWAHAAQGFDTAPRARSLHRLADRGRDEALRVLAHLFADEIAQGHDVIFTADGLRIHA